MFSNGQKASLLQQIEKQNTLPDLNQAGCVISIKSNLNQAK